MELPKYHETFLPILKTLNSAESLKSRELVVIIRDNYYSHLPEELLKLELLTLLGQKVKHKKLTFVKV